MSLSTPATTPYEYPVSLKVDYSNSQEYRECVRRIFQMDSAKYPEIVNDMDIDAESKDENKYDDDASAKAMETIFEKTKDCPALHDLYLLAAARMFSTEPDIGLAILLSYDYLFFLHQILAEFFQDNETFKEENHPMILEIKQRLQ